MNILYINTSGEFCELALFDKTIVVAHLVHESAMQHSTVLHTMINELLQANSLSVQNIDAIGVLNGPGSYTGLRIGLATAKGFCYALDIPLVLFNKLELGCDFYQDEHPEIETIGCIQYARDGEYFLAMKKNGNNIIQAAVYESEKVNELLSEHSESVLICYEKNILEDIQHETVPIILSLKHISETLSNRLTINKVNDIYSSEPFYLKKVHANKPKSLF